MSDLVQLTNENGIAVISINNPPVNALSPGVPEGIAAAIEQIDKDESIKAAVIDRRRQNVHRWRRHQGIWKNHLGQGRQRIGFTVVPFENRRLPQARCDGHSWNAPLVAASKSPWPGHYRVAVPSAQVGQPEVKLGHHPGRGWYAAPAAACRRGESCRDVRGRQSDQSRKTL